MKYCFDTKTKEQRDKDHIDLWANADTGISVKDGFYYKSYGLYIVGPMFKKDGFWSAPDLNILKYFDNGVSADSDFSNLMKEYKPGVGRILKYGLFSEIKDLFNKAFSP